MSNARMSKVGKHLTTVFEPEVSSKYTVVTYVTTNVVMFNDEEIIINSGGWGTPTTVRRIEQAFNQFGLGQLPNGDKIGYTYKDGMSLVLKDKNCKIKQLFKRLVIDRNTNTYIEIEEVIYES